MSLNNNNSINSKQARDGFFIVSMSAWENLFNTSIKFSESNTVRVLATYLTLSCGSGGDHTTTSWSAGAIRKYAGISQKPAERSLKTLKEYEFIDTIKEPKKNKLPIYKINFFDKSPKEQSTDNIFIPNGVVTGVAGEQSPLKRLVQYQDPYLLYLFIRLYGFQDKYLDVIDPSIVSTTINTDNKLNAETIYDERGILRIWATAEALVLSSFDSTPFYNFTVHDDDDRFYCERTENDSVFGLLSILTGLGLIDIVTYACSGERAHCADEIDFICETKTERQLITIKAVSDFAESKHHNIIDTLDCYQHQVILPANYRKVHFQQFYRLRYRTKLGEVRNKYAEENELYKVMSNCMSGILKQ